MPFWWGKSSKEEKKKSNRGSILCSLHRRCMMPRSPRKQHDNSTSEKESASRDDSGLQSSSKEGSSCQSCGERPQAQSIPFQCGHMSGISGTDTGSSASEFIKPSLDKSFKDSLFMPLPKPGHIKIGQRAVVGEWDLAIVSNFGDSSSDIDDLCDSCLLNPQASDYEGIKSDVPSPSRLNQKDHSPFSDRMNTRETLMPGYILLNHQPSSASPMQRLVISDVPHSQVPLQAAFPSAPDSSMASPPRSPVTLLGHNPAVSGGFSRKSHADISLLGPGHIPNQGSGCNSDLSSVIGDASWQHRKCSTEGSPLPSPKNMSPGPGSRSRMNSGASTPSNPSAADSSAESPTSWPDDAKQQRYPLPLPPAIDSNHSPFTPYSSGTSPRIRHSPGRTDNRPAFGSCWRKGRLLGRGTYGQVYLGFNSESGEMCAMKEVTLCSDDARSRESAEQLEQEIALLSRLHHPNIVQYYGSEMVDDKLCIYLEYVSGGSICKILQEYGQLGEAAVRSYTQQIISGLAYLHSKSTLHRDIKGANILVDPNGRVKVADFGMAKHITGEFCPLSFKGSPYWMAPEVIKKSGSCNFAVDIWSLGCTVLEMATAKPPWSQYEGVAAMFKIGNSKELPAMPDQLSDEGKDFVRLCLQRKPCDRPTAAQLLKHPFVQNASSSERYILSTEPGESVPALTHAVKMLDVISCGAPFQDSSGSPGHHKSPRTVLGFRDGGVAGNISCPVSPLGSPLSHSRSPRHLSGGLSPSPISPQHLSGRLSPPISPQHLSERLSPSPPISSPKCTSSVSTPTGGTTPKYHPMAINYWPEERVVVPKSPKSVHSNAISYWEHKPNVFGGIVQARLSLEPL